MNNIILWFKGWFWKKCPICKNKKEWFYYTWEFPMSKECTKYNEVCIDCAGK